MVTYLIAEIILLIIYGLTTKFGKGSLNTGANQVDFDAQNAAATEDMRNKYSMF